MGPWQGVTFLLDCYLVAVDIRDREGKVLKRGWIAQRFYYHRTNHVALVVETTVISHRYRAGLSPAEQRTIDTSAASCFDFTNSFQWHSLGLVRNQGDAVDVALVG